MAKRHWLMKSEPDTFAITDLARVKVEPWSGVRSFFARANMRAMSIGDDVLFHHSSVTPPGVAGLARVVRTNVVDQTQFDPESPYYEPKATPEAPIWDCVDVEYVETLPYFVTMDRMRAEPALAEMVVLKPGRLSVQPATEHEYEVIVRLGHTEPPLEPPRPAKASPTRAMTAKARPAAKARPGAKAPRAAKTKRVAKARPVAKARSMAKPPRVANARPAAKAPRVAKTKRLAKARPVAKARSMAKPPRVAKATARPVSTGATGVRS